MGPKKKKKGRKRKQSTTGPRPGRALEELVARLERALAGKGVVITSPDHLPDRDTGESREVDVSLKTSIGSASLLIIVECRDRGRAQDVRWIEELVQKGKSVGAHKVLAVSPNGFTSNALTKGKRGGG